MSVSCTTIVLDSTTAGNGISNDFTVNFYGLPVKDYEVALGGITLTYSWNNISAAVGNNIIGYKTSSVGVTTFITLPDGNYTLDAINTFLQTSIVEGGGTGTNVVISANGTTLKTNVVLSGGYCLDLTSGGLYSLLGWSNGLVISTQGLTASPNDANITTVNTVLVHCSLVSDNYYNGTNSDVLYTFPPNYQPGSLIAINPLPVIFTKINAEKVFSIRVYITDDSNKSLNLNNQPVTVTLLIRPKGSQ